MREIKKIASNILILLLAWSLLAGCEDDYHTKLSGGYVFRHEGSTINDILGSGGNKNDIPVNVISCFYNDKFIIAIQIPDKVDNAIYNTTPEYKEGRDKLYYWLIVQKDNVFLGPMNEAEFRVAKDRYKVPDVSELKSIIIDTARRD